MKKVKKVYLHYKQSDLRDFFRESKKMCQEIQKIIKRESKEMVNKYKRYNGMN